MNNCPICQEPMTIDDSWSNPRGAHYQCKACSLAATKWNDIEHMVYVRRLGNLVLHVPNPGRAILQVVCDDAMDALDPTWWQDRKFQ